MILLIVLTGLLMIATWWIAGFSIVAVAAVVTWVLFAMRAVGYFCKLNNVLVIEGLAMFFLVTYQLMLKRPDVQEWLWLVVVRIAALLVMRHDIKNYVYVTEEQRHDLP